MKLISRVSAKTHPSTSHAGSAAKLRRRRGFPPRPPSEAPPTPCPAQYAFCVRACKRARPLARARACVHTRAACAGERARVPFSLLDRLNSPHLCGFIQHLYLNERVVRNTTASTTIQNVCPLYHRMWTSMLTKMPKVCSPRTLLHALSNRMHYYYLSRMHYQTAILSNQSHAPSKRMHYQTLWCV